MPKQPLSAYQPPSVAESMKVLGIEPVPSVEHDYTTAHLKAVAKEQRIAEASAKFVEVLDAAAASRCDAPHIVELVSEIYKQMGGYANVVRRFLNNVNIAEEERPGSKTVIDAYHKIFKLTSEANKQSHAENVAQMTDEELKFQRQLAVLEVLADKAKEEGGAALIVKILEAQGVEVTPETIDLVQHV